MAKNKQPQRQIRIVAISTLYSVNITVPEKKAEKILKEIKDNYISLTKKNKHNSEQIGFVGCAPSDCAPLKVEIKVV